jgi:hypothetical protein
MKFILCVFPRFSNCTSIGMKFITCVFPNISIHMCISRKNWSFTLRCPSFVFQGWTEVLPCGVCR